MRKIILVAVLVYVLSMFFFFQFGYSQGWLKETLEFKGIEGEELQYDIHLRSKESTTYNDTKVERIVIDKGKHQLKVTEVTPEGVVKGDGKTWSYERAIFQDGSWIEEIPEEPVVIDGRYERDKYGKRIVEPGSLEEILELTTFPHTLYLPVVTGEPVGKGSRWQEKLIVAYGRHPAFRFDLLVKFHLERFLWYKGFYCAEIAYSYKGNFNIAEHPELFPPEKLQSFKVSHNLCGYGTVLFAVPEGKIVHKCARCTIKISEKRLEEQQWIIFRIIRHEKQLKLEIEP